MAVVSGIPTHSRIQSMQDRGTISPGEAMRLHELRDAQDSQPRPRSTRSRSSRTSQPSLPKVPMPRSKAMRWVLLAVLIVWVTGNVREIRRGVAPSPTVTVGAVVLAFFLAVLAEIAPKLAASFAGLIIVATLLSGPDAIQAVAGAASSRVAAGRRLGQVRAGTRPPDSAFTRPGFIGPPTAEQVG